MWRDNSILVFIDTLHKCLRSDWIKNLKAKFKYLYILYIHPHPTHRSTHPIT